MSRESHGKAASNDVSEGMPRTGMEIGRVGCCVGDRASLTLPGSAKDRVNDVAVPGLRKPTMINKHTGCW